MIFTTSVFKKYTNNDWEDCDTYKYTNGDWAECDVYIYSESELSSDDDSADNINN